MFSLYIGLARQHRQQRILPQLIVVVEIFVAQREAVDSLPDQLAHGVLDQRRLPVIAETGRKLAQDAGALLDRAQ